MALHITDRIYLQVSISGAEIPLDKLNMFDYLHIVESVRVYMPILTFRLIDATKFLVSNNLLLDGAPIKVTVGQSDTKRTYNFRLFSVQNPAAEGGDAYIITGYLDAPKYWIESTPQAIIGTPTEALSQIAATCGMSFEGEQTADSQLWLPSNTRYCEFSRQVSERGFVDPSSCMQMVLTTQKKLRYKNVSKAPGNRLETFSNRGNYENATPITDYKLISKSGFFNSTSGYQDTRVAQSVANPEDDLISEVSVKKNTRHLNMNSGVKGSIKQGRVSFAPVDVGNVGPNYEQALYQNRRLSSLYSLGVDIVLPTFVDTDILDYVLCDFSKPDISGVKEISGAFLLTSKVLYVQGMNVYQKVEAYRQGLNNNAASQV